MPWPPDENDRRPGGHQDGDPDNLDAGSGGVVTAIVRPACPLWRAARRSGDLHVELAVARFHPDARCAYVERAA